MKTAIIFLSFILSFFYATEEKILVLKNVNVVDIQNRQITYRYNVFIRGKKIWKVRKSKQTDKHLIVFPSIDMSGKFLLTASLLPESANLTLTQTQEYLLAEAMKCENTPAGCLPLSEGQEASFIILSSNPLDQNLKTPNIEEVFSKGNRESDHQKATKD